MESPEKPPSRRTLPVIPPELRDEKLPTGVFSASQYGLYKKCPKAYDFRYNQGKRCPPGVAMFRGTSVHAGTEVAHQYMIDKKVMPPLGLLEQTTSQVFDEGAAEIVDWEGEKPGTVKDTSISLIRAYHARALPGLQPIAAEEPFITRVGVVPVVGFIDLVVHEQGPPLAGVVDPGQLAIEDTKTSSAKWSQTDVDDDPQLTLYSIVKGIYHVRISNLVPLKAGPAYHRISATRDRHAKAVLVEDLEETVDLVKRGIFPRTSIDNWACKPKWCGYWSQCRGKRM